jgi:hypothetical protein
MNRQIIETTRYIAEEVSKIDGIYIMGDPEVSVVAIGKSHFFPKAFQMLSDLLILILGYKSSFNLKRPEQNVNQ